MLGKSGWEYRGITGKVIRCKPVMLSRDGSIQIQFGDDELLRPGSIVRSPIFKHLTPYLKYDMEFSVTEKGYRTILRHSIRQIEFKKSESGGVEMIATPVKISGRGRGTTGTTEIDDGGLVGESEKTDVGTGTTDPMANFLRETIKEAIKTETKASPLTGYYIERDVRSAFTTAKRISDGNPQRAVKLMMVGPSGYGKTTLPRLFAQVTGMGFYRMNCASIRDPEEWFGYREARDGSTVFLKSEFIKLLEAGNLVVVLDEFNRLEPWLHNTLFPMLDDDGCTVIHDEKVAIGPNVIVVATINTGYKYTGVFELDEALMNRFEFVLSVGPLPVNEEENVLIERTGVNKKVAQTIVNVASEMRRLEAVCSTRTTLLIAQMVQAGMNLREAYENAVVRRIVGSDAQMGMRKQVIDRLNIMLGTMDDKAVENDVFGGYKPEVETPPAKEEAYATDGTINVTLRMTDLAFANAVYAIKLLRRYGVETKSLKESKDTFDALRSGSKVSHFAILEKEFSEMVIDLEKAYIAVERE